MREKERERERERERRKQMMFSLKKNSKQMASHKKMAKKPAFSASLGHFLVALVCVCVSVCVCVGAGMAVCVCDVCVGGGGGVVCVACAWLFIRFEIRHQCTSKNNKQTKNKIDGKAKAASAASIKVGVFAASMVAALAGYLLA